jgi:hypothetical protein
MANLFTEHPASVGETYLEHMGVAFGFALRLVGAGAACFVHGLVPFLFTRTGSTMITHLHEGMVAARRRHGEEPRRGDEAIQADAVS